MRAVWCKVLYVSLSAVQGAAPCSAVRRRAGGLCGALRRDAVARSACLRSVAALGWGVGLRGRWGRWHHGETGILTTLTIM